MIQCVNSALFFNCVFIFWNSDVLKFRRKKNMDPQPQKEKQGQVRHKLENLSFY